MKCACLDFNCRNQITFGSDGIWISHVKSGEVGPLLIQADANTLVELIREAREALINIANKERA